MPVSVAGAVESALSHEILVTASIDRLCGMALEQRDFASLSFLQVFAVEQVEECDEARRVVAYRAASDTDVEFDAGFPS
jgi:ferritin